jgi:PDZ domain-containing protein/aspartyl protease
MAILQSRFVALCLFVSFHLVFVPSSAQTPANKPSPRFRFTAGKSALKIPFDLSNNLIILQVRVNKSRPLNFIFDTGAGVSVIDPKTARALRLKEQGKLKLGATGGSVESGLIKGVSLGIPGVEVFDQTISTVSLESLTPLFGFRLDGIIGHDFIKNFVVEIDYPAGLINLREPQSYTYSGPGESVPITFMENTPFVRATVLVKGRDPIEGKFEVDTGGNGTLNVNTPFVNTHKLLEAVPNLMQSKLAGAGGASQAAKGRVAGVKVGSFVVEDPLVVFAQGTEGNESSIEFDGELGGAFFRRFKLILDYSRSRIILERYNGVLEVEDASGMEVFAEGANLRTFVVNDVTPNSPASDAGLQEEDIIVSLNGRPAASFTLKQLRQMFTHDGTEYTLGIKRGEKLMRVKIKLRRM